MAAIDDLETMALAAALTQEQIDFREVNAHVWIMKTQAVSRVLERAINNRGQVAELVALVEEWGPNAETVAAWRRGHPDCQEWSCVVMFLARILGTGPGWCPEALRGSIDA